ncbi:MAG: hypothetical protein KIT84_38360 [Labilithrix sp.]|nr:hypothetical protein [Labilithrix sp.]MCW5816924.1 hypothetical protein [Labilithrix sp.]
MRWARTAAIAIVLASGVSGVSGVVHEAHAKPTAPKEPPPAEVEVAEQLYSKLDYEKANDVALRVLKKQGLTHDQLIRATKILAITYAVLDKEEESRDAFMNLLVYDPELTVDSALGPKVSGPFMEARGQFRQLPTKPGLEVTANVRTEGGQLRVTTRDPTKLAKKVTVGWRWNGAGDFSVSSVNIGDSIVEVASAPAGKTRLDYYAQALDERDGAVFETGSPSVPKSIFAEAGARPTGAAGKSGTTTGPQGEDKKGGSIFGSPLFWVITGAIVAGGAAGTYFFLQGQNPPTSAQLSPTIRCGTDLCK